MDQSKIIQDFLQDELLLFDKYFRESVKSYNPRVAEMITYVFNTSGKRLRPMLVLLTAKACGRILPETYHGAVTVELLHTATLVHDDVIDKSETRRGKESVNAVFDNTKAVLIGDYLLSTALMESVKTNDLGIVGIIAELGQNLSEGELNQYSLAQEVIMDEDAYFEVIDKKTASLMRASITIGAITGGADKELISQFSRLGGLLGICFQIRDDIFDYYHTDVGKPTGNDIKEGKITLPLIYALQHAPQTLADEVKQLIFSRNYSEANITKILAFARDHHGVQYAYDRMNDFLEEAESIITNFSFNSEIKSLMRLFLAYVKERRY